MARVDFEGKGFISHGDSGTAFARALQTSLREKWHEAAWLSGDLGTGEGQVHNAFEIAKNASFIVILIGPDFDVSQRGFGLRALDRIGSTEKETATFLVELTDADTPDPIFDHERLAELTGFEALAFRRLFRMPLSEVHSDWRPSVDALAFEIMSRAVGSDLPEEAAVYKSGGGREATGTPRRQTNLCFAQAKGSPPLPPAFALGARKTYALRVNIGRPSPDSIVANPLVFDMSSLEENDDGHWLDVLVSSDAFRIDRAAHRLFLPQVGESWTCEAGDGAPETVGDAERQRHLWIEVETPPDPGKAQLRLLFYYKRNLIESHIVTATVALDEMPGGVTQSVIDFTLTDGMRDVEALPDTDVSILSEIRPDGTHSLILNGDPSNLVEIALTEGQMRGAIDAARNSLYAIHIEKIDGGLFGQNSLRNRYDEDNAKPLADFKKDFARQAELGWKLWTALRGGDADKRDAVHAALARRSTIQVARAAHTNFVFPWALVYDIPLGSDPSEYSFCPCFDEPQKWRDAETQECCAQADHHVFNTLCPFGFWGLKHSVEQPPSVAGLPLTTGVIDPRGAVIAEGLEGLNTLNAKAHLNRMGDTLSAFEIARCDTSRALRAALAADVELVYFYCHGRVSKDPHSQHEVPALEVGDGEVIEPSDVTAWSDGLWPCEHWKAVSPLVFVNGCHTTEITPDALVSFVDAFVGVRAAGVIGTEVAIYQNVAAEVAETFFDALVQGLPVGDALRTTRWAMLRKGNLMGLAYTPYCAGSLSLYR